MHKSDLMKAVSDVRDDWNAVIAELGPQGMERPGATGEWRVRDVIAQSPC